MSVELGIIGAGNMAEAIARAVIGAGLLGADQIMASDLSSQRREVFERDLKVRATEDNRDVAGQARTLLLSVKPQHMAEVLRGIAPVIHPSTLILSIAAGISTRFIEEHLGGGSSWRVIRTMPNTPMLVGQGMAAMTRGRFATPEDAIAARKLFETAAIVIDVSEDKMDAVTAVSGSGPAYIFYLVEQMIRAAVELGFSDAQARQLAVQTALGASKMLAGCSESAEELRRKVTSPGGTTHAAISHMEQNRWAQTTVDAIKAAERRGKELGK